MKLSPAERTILEALLVSPDLPKIQIRADVLLRAGAGAEDEQIAAELAMQRKDVLHWRKRYEAQGIRGLWDSPGPGLKKRVSPGKESAILDDVLYQGLHWDAKLLAQRHGLSRSAVNRIFAKHGIVRGQWGRIDIKHLKVFVDPLFGVTVVGIAGMYYGTSGAIALTSTRRPFSELCVSAPGISTVQAFHDFTGELRKLDEFRMRKLRTVAIHAVVDENYFLSWLNAIEARRESSSDVHLLLDLPRFSPYDTAGVQQWFGEHPHFQMHYAPLVTDLCWFSFVQRCFAIIATLPVQVQLVEDVSRTTRYLAHMTDEQRLEMTAIIHTMHR